MNKYILVLIFLFSVSLGCIAQDPIIGCWENVYLGQKSNIEFYSNGTINMDTAVIKSIGTWERIDSERILVERKSFFNTEKTEIIYYNEKTKTFYHQDYPNIIFYNVECI